MIYPLGLVNTKQQEFFFVSSFVLLLAYASTMFLCLCLCRSICRRLDCIPLFCLLFVLFLMLMPLVWNRLNTFRYFFLVYMNPVPLLEVDKILTLSHLANPGHRIKLTRSPTLVKTCPLFFNAHVQNTPSIRHFDAILTPSWQVSPALLTFRRHLPVTKADVLYL